VEKLISMKMKNYLNILSMNRETFCFKLISALIVFFLFSSVEVKSQNQSADSKAIRVISGTIRDAHTKKPIAAAQISVPDEKLSAVSDDKGKFSLKISSSKAVLSISAYDYNQSEVAVRGKDSLVIDLYSNQFSNYFKSIEGLTGSVNNSALIASEKSVEDVSKTGVIAADELLQSTLGGDVRGITRSGVAGMGASLFIRGVNSLNANAQPLFVIDGVIWNNLYDVQSIHEGFFSNPLDNIDVNDIEDISVLKDGTSIYGSKAANGVILIKTKRAKSMVTKISLNIFSGLTTMPGNIPMMNGEEFRMYASDLLKSKGTVTGNDVSSYGFLETDPAKLKIYKTDHNVTDWSKQVYQPGMTNSYMINANGGDEKALYYFSLGYTDNKGVVKSTSMNRINSRFNADFKLFKLMTLGFNIGFSNVERKLLDDGVVYTSPTWVSKIKSPFLSPYSYTNEGQLSANYDFADEFDISNPSGIIQRSVNNLKKFRFNIGVLPSFSITPDLTLSSQFDYSLDKTVEGRFVPMYYTPEIDLPSYGTSFDEVNSQVMRNIGVFDETRLTYQKNLDKYNHLKAILGWRYINNYYESDYAEEHNTGANNNTTITGAYKYLQVKGINNYTKSLSNYLNVNYDFNNRYFVSGVVAVDGSSRFGNETAGGFSMFGHSWGVFPSINGGWIVSSEKFMKNIDFVNFCKVRGGYGITGNDGIKDYEAMAYFSSVRFMDKANGLVLSNLYNSKVQWETTGKTNLGIDLGLFKNRLSLTVDYFWSRTSDLLVLRDLPEVSGLGKYWFNGGVMDNKGYEVSANLKVLNFKKLKWELGLNVGHYLNKIVALPDGDYSTSVYGGEVRTAVGQSAGAFYGYKTNGVFTTESQAATANLKIANVDGTFSTFGAGDMIFVDKNKDGFIDGRDKQIIGNPNPDLYGTVSSKLSFDRFTLNTIFTYSYGNDVYNYQRSQLEAGTDFSNQTSAMLRRWTADGQITDQPKAVYGDPMGNSRFSDRWIEDGSYIRMKTISLSYELPIKSDFIEGFNVWISANNLITVTKYLGLDPEFSAGNSVYYQGVDAGLLPQTKSYYIGIKFNL
jgi:TonB-linked SusC/RagA family outer membrane protein